MNDQLTLGLVRSTDKDTAHAAAVSVVPHLPAMRHRVLVAVVALGQATAHDVWVRWRGEGPAENSISKRLGELVATGLLVETAARRPGRTGRPQIVYRPTAEGRSAA